MRGGRSSASGRAVLAHARGILVELFPESPESPEPPETPARGQVRRWLIAAVYVLCIVAGAALSLVRYVGLAPWKTVYAEDYPVYLVEALAHPWRSIFTSYAGYEQLVPRLIAWFVTLLPLHDAAAGLAITGALVASAVAVFVFCASAGHVHSIVLRVLLGMSVLLLPVALLEIANTGVNTPWYLLIALFWALLWRPRSKAGIAVAALAGFVAASSNITAVVFVVLVAIRVIALPRVREQAVSIGWLAGCLVQLPYVLTSTSTSSSRLSQLAAPGQTASFYGHDVLLPAFGWHLSWLLRHWVGRDYGVLIIGGLIAIAATVALFTGTRRVRVFAATALGFGFLFAAFAATVTWWVTVNPVKFGFEPGARYTGLPILLITAAAVVAIDGRLREVSVGSAWSLAAVLAMTAVLCVGWIPDFRYAAHRTEAPAWAPILSQWVRTCQHHDAIYYPDSYDSNVVMVIPCARVRGQ
ncbi:MAG: hypothetical protein JO345_05950 [Streptosporangiaceae bacterium]|nr:hypothetical protein [Streptosporangiaceae bacterium]